MSPFDPAANFLLATTDYSSLFEPALSGGETDYRCKGCREIVKRWRRLDHWQTHKTIQARLEAARKEHLRVERAANLALARQQRKEQKAA